MTLQELKSLDVSLSYASIVDALGKTPFALKIAYVPSLVASETECDLDPKTVRPIGRPTLSARFGDIDMTDAFDKCFLTTYKQALWQWMMTHRTGHLNVYVLSDIRWYWMGTNDGKDPFFESDVIAHDLSTPKTRAFPYDYIVFRIYPKPTQKEA